MNNETPPNEEFTTPNAPQTEAVSNVLGEAMRETDPKNGQTTVAAQEDLTAYHARIAELEGQVKDAKEAHARANAEAYNARNRMEQETEKTKKYAIEKFAKSMLDVVDNLERAIINSANSQDKALLEGVKLTHKSLLSALEKNGISVVEPQGEKFNADFHEAVGIDPNTPADTVGEVLQKGYVLNDRLLRPAMVRVGQ